jgi:hypothetical protein
LLTEIRLTRTESLLLVSLFAVNPIFISFLDYIVSDIPFLFSVFLVLLLITKLDAKQGAWRQVFLGAAVFFAFFIRTTGVVLLASFLVYQALLFYREQTKRRTIAQNSIIVIAVFILFWLTSSLIFPNGQGSYFQQLMGFTLETLLKNIHDYFYLFVHFFDSNSNPAWTFIYYILVAFFLIGVWKQRNTDHILIIFFVLYFAVMLIWPEWQGIRFIFPLLPIFIYFSFQGIRTVVEKLPEKHQQFGGKISISFWLVIVAVFLFNSGTQAYTNLKEGRKINGPFDSYSDDMFNFIKAETPPESVIVFFKPRAMRLFTDRDSIMVLECDRLKLGDYIVLHKTWEYSQILPDKIQDCKQSIELVFENRRFLVYEILK